MRNGYLPNALKKLCNLEGDVMVRGTISSAGVVPLVCFHGNASVSKELHRQHSISRLRKETVETPIFTQNNAPGHKARTVLSFLEEEGINSSYEVATTKPRYELFRECIENHRRETSEQKSLKY